MNDFAGSLPPAQIPASGIPALGSCHVMGTWRRTALRAKGA